MKGITQNQLIINLFFFAHLISLIYFYILNYTYHIYFATIYKKIKINLNYFKNYVIYSLLYKFTI